MSTTEILGQKISLPNSWHGTVCFMALCATFIASLYMFFSLPDGKFNRTVQLINAGRFDENGDTQDSQKSYQMGFWTPSLKTKDFWVDWQTKNPGKKVPKDDRWEMKDFEKKINLFIEQLACGKGCPIIGFRYHEVTGKGRGDYKPGLWWEATIEEEFPPKYFVRRYHTIWGESRPLYLEVRNKTVQLYEDGKR